MRFGRRELIAGLLATTAGYAAARYVLTPGATHPDDTTSLPVPPAPVEAPAEVPHTVAEAAAPTSDVATRPAWFRDALAEMRDTEAPGVAIVLPADPAEREALRSALDEIVGDPTRYDGFTTLNEAVYLVAQAGWVGAAPGETLVLLAPDGRRLAASREELTVESFRASARALLRAGDLHDERVKRERTPEVLAALKEFEDARPAVSPELQQRLCGLVRRSAAALIYEFERRGSGAAERALYHALSGEWDLRSARDVARPLPFGAGWTQGRDVPRRDPCPGCGMMSVGRHFGDTLRLLADLPAPPK